MSALARGRSKGWLAARQNRFSGEGAARLQYGIQISSFDPMATTTTSMAHFSNPSFHIDREANAVGVRLRRDGTANGPAGLTSLRSAHLLGLPVPSRHSTTWSPEQGLAIRSHLLLRKHAANAFGVALTEGLYNRPAMVSRLSAPTAGGRRDGHQSGDRDGIPE